MAELNADLFEVKHLNVKLSEQDLLFSHLLRKLEAMKPFKRLVIANRLAASIGRQIYDTDATVSHTHKPQSRKKDKKKQSDKTPKSDTVKPDGSGGGGDGDKPVAMVTNPSLANKVQKGNLAPTAAWKQTQEFKDYLKAKADLSTAKIQQNVEQLDSDHPLYLKVQTATTALAEVRKILKDKAALKRTDAEEKANEAAGAAKAVPKVKASQGLGAAAEDVDDDPGSKNQD
jgi:stress response protein SCP2